MTASSADDFARRIREYAGTARREVAENDEPEYQGASSGEILEHQTRQFLIDQMLQELGWERKRLTREVIEEARLQAENTLFIDYLLVDDTSRVPVALIEAKKYDAPALTFLGDHELRGFDKSINLAAALKTYDADTGPKLNATWAQWIEKIRKYVATLREKHNQELRRVVITNGKWIAIFLDPNSAFLKDGEIKIEDIIYIEDLIEIEGAKTLYECLARNNLARRILPQASPEETAHFKSRFKEAYGAIILAVSVTGATHAKKPRADLYPAIVIKLDGHAFLPVTVSTSIPLPGESSQLEQHIEDMRQHIAALREEIQKFSREQLKMGKLIDFPGFPTWKDRGISSGIDIHDGPNKEYVLRTPGNRQMLIIVAEHNHYLHPEVSVPKCKFHNWGEAAAVSKQASNVAHLEISTEPLVLFPSGTSYHCAHRTIHDLRAEFCFFKEIDSHLCCKACIFQKICWAPTEDRLPCP